MSCNHSVWWIITWRFQFDDEDSLSIVEANSRDEAVERVQMEALNLTDINELEGALNEAFYNERMLFINHIVRAEGPRPLHVENPNT